MENVEFSLRSCEDISGPCPRAPQPNWPGRPFDILPPPRRTTVDIILPEGLYFRETKICFHASFNYIFERPFLGIFVDFGDQQNFTEDLNLALVSRGKRSTRVNPRFYQGLDAYGRNSNVSEMNRDIVTRLNSKQNLRTCYKENCSFNLLFHHKYTRFGEYTVKMKLSNSTHEINSTLSQKLTIVGDGFSMQGLICNSHTRTNTPTVFQVTDGTGYALSWSIIPRSGQHQNRATFIAASPLRYMFNESGLFDVVINNLDSCTVMVQDESALNVENPDNMISTLGLGNVSYNVEQGTDVKTRWEFMGQRGGNNVGRNAPFQDTATFLLDTVGCHTLFIEALNMASSVNTSVLVCGEEPIEGLNVRVPKLVYLHEQRNISVSYERGSYTELVLSINCAGGMLNMEFRHTSDQLQGPGYFNFLTSKFPRQGVFQVQLTAWNNVSRVELTSEIHVGHLVNDLKISNVLDPNLNFAVDGEENVLVAFIDNQPTSAVLYTWEYWRMASGSTIQQTTVQTTSPVFKFTPICPSFPCFVNLTAKSMSNQSHTFMSVVSLNRQPLTIYLQHPVIVEAGVEFEIDVNCISSYTHETGCRGNSLNSLQFSVVTIWQVYFRNNA
ncbi:uncharacterized protein LOC144742527 [Ciona intestinalis]